MILRAASQGVSSFVAIEWLILSSAGEFGGRLAESESVGRAPEGVDVAAESARLPASHTDSMHTRSSVRPSSSLLSISVTVKGELDRFAEGSGEVLGAREAGGFAPGVVVLQDKGDAAIAPSSSPILLLHSSPLVSFLLLLYRSCIYSTC